MQRATRFLAFVATASSSWAPSCLDELADIAVTSESDPKMWNSTHRVNNPDYNAQGPVSPAFVALPRTVADVQRCLQCATARGLRAVVKGGGHSFGGYSTIPAKEGFQINMAQMTKVSDISKPSGPRGPGRVVAGAGARWRDVYKQFYASGDQWVVTGGLCPSVGVAGFTMGGGVGPAVRLHGMAIDTVRRFEVVTSNGSCVVNATAQENPDLFWALRGAGGGNFGVVTEIEFDVFPGPDAYSYGDLCFDWADAGRVLAAVQARGQLIPRTINIDLVMDKTGGACLWVVAMHPLNETRALIAPLVEGLPSPTRDTLAEMDCWWEMIKSFAVERGYQEYSSGPYLSKNCLIDSVSQGLIDTILDLGDSAPEICAGHHFISFGGRSREVLPNATAFPWRDTLYMVYSECDFDEGDEAAAEQSVAYLDRWVKEITPYCNGGSYVNFIDPLLATGPKSAYEQAYYGQNAERLREIKARWNPIDSKSALHFPMEIS